jgi:UDP-2,3-diacylglucosamine pyrophosphatase LpxH
LSYTGKNKGKSRPPLSDILPDMPTLFLSDVHLGAFSDSDNRKIESDLIRLIHYCETKQLRMVILGDFFDFWMEYSGKPPPLGQAVLRRFRDYHSKTGSHTLYITGNHDNWTDEYLRKVGFDVEHEYRILRSNDTSIMVMHGDGLQDPGMKLPRPAMHRFLRNPYFVSLYQAILPSTPGWSIMQMFSGMNRKMEDSAKSRRQRELLDAWARTRVRDDDSIQAIIYGHHHHPVLWQKRGKTCMNCGFFGRDRTAGLYTNNNFKIVIWDADNEVLSDMQISQNV